jgi:hypothetical protein
MAAFIRTLFGRPSAIPIWLRLALSVVVPAAILYAVFPTCDYYWDGVIFSLGIESASGAGIAPLIVPNHLMYSVLGFGIYWPFHQLSAAVRALPVLQLLDTIASLLSALLLFRLLYRLFEERYAALALTAIFAFGATWWRYSVDADAYIVSTLFILAAATRLLLHGTRRLWVTGAWHCAAMVMHQLAVFFLPAVWVTILLNRNRSLRWRLLTGTAYTAATGTLTLAVYYAGFRIPNSQPIYRSFGAWVTSHSGDSAFSFRPGYILGGTFKSYVQLFFGGRIRNLVEFHNLATLILAAVLVIAITAFLTIVWKYRSDFVLLEQAIAEHAIGSRTLAICGAWFLSYAIFLLFWLPRNTFYKLLVWPALIFLLGWVLHAFRERGGARRYRTALFAGIVLLWNFVFFVYPNSKPESNPLLVFADSMQPHWPSGTTVYFQTFNTDDWLIRYKNPQTVWQSLNCAAPNCAGRLAENTETFWLDTTALDFLEKASPGMRVWLSSGQVELHKLEGSGRRVKFAKIRPQAR